MFIYIYNWIVGAVGIGGDGMVIVGEVVGTIKTVALIEMVLRLSEAAPREIPIAKIAARIPAVYHNTHQEHYDKP